MAMTRNGWLRAALLVSLIAVLSLVPLVTGGARMVEDIMLVSTGLSERGGNNDSTRPKLSADGSTLVFQSYATDLVDGLTTNGKRQIYAYDIATGTTTLISAGGGTGGDDVSGYPAISGDGTRIVFESEATDLIEGVVCDGTKHIFLYDSVTGKTIQVDQRFAGSDESAYEPAISQDGTKIVYDSSAPDLIEGVTVTVIGYPVFRYDVETAKTILVTEVAPHEGVTGEYPSISGDGSRITFRSGSGRLVAGVTDTNLYLWDEADGFTCLTRGVGDVAHDGDFENSFAAISSDGTKIVFHCRATNLTVPATSGDLYQAYLWDEANGVSLLTTGSAGNEGDGDTYGTDISPDGMTVGVASEATDLAAGLTANGNMNIYRYDLASGEVELITQGAAGNGGDEDSYRPSIISMGPNGLMAFHSEASDLVEGLDVFVPDNWEGRIPRNVYLWGRVQLLTVTFDAQNGTAPVTGEVAWGSTAPVPRQPTKAGFEFVGWWTAPDGGSLWDFATPVTADITLYAHWAPILPATGDAFNLGDWIADNWWLFALAALAIIGALLWWWTGRNKEEDEHALVDVGPAEDDDTKPVDEVLADDDAGEADLE